MNDYLSHYGILGMKWGIRRYQNKDGSLTIEGRKHYGGSEKDHDLTIKKGTKLQTLSMDKNRTKDAEFFYTAFTENDKQYYRDMFSRSTDNIVPFIKIPKMKYNIINKTVNDVKVASMKSGEDAMFKLYEKDSDFKDFVNNPERMFKYMRKDYNKQVYNNAVSILNNINKRGSATHDEVQAVYKLWNYIIPNDGSFDGSDGVDIAKQRKKFFDVLNDAGYGAVLDTNDSYYGNYGNNVESAVIVFDQSAIIPDSVKKMKYSDAIIGKRRQSVKRQINRITGRVV